MSNGNAFTRSLSRLSRRKKKNRNREQSEEEAAVVEEYHPAPPPTSQQLPLSLHVDIGSEAMEHHSKHGLLHRGMDRLRRSIRHSLRRKKNSEERPNGELVQSSSGQKSELWQPDDAAVRGGVCSFTVKYLGSVEVFESRGMQVCEGALKLLRAQRRRPVKAVLYVSGDGLRVVDQENNRGLIVDQTIEKVSFCAPDRSNDRGFAYICRDGTTRRWMCHGFQASKESGERLSHAVGCAFAVCLERKKKRDEETTQNVTKLAEKGLNPDWDDNKDKGNSRIPSSTVPSSSSSASVPSSSLQSNQVDPTSNMQRVNPAYSSFRRQLTISERLQDPQTAILPVPSKIDEKNVVSTAIAKPRPAANPQLFQRQGSLRAPESSTSFRRQLSLRPTANGFDSSPLRIGGGVSLFNDPIYEGDEDLLRSNTPQSSQTAIPNWNNSSMGMGISGPSFSNGSALSTSNSVPNGINPHSTHSLQMPQSIISLDESITVNTSSDGWSDLPEALPTNRSKADDWLDNALRQITISPTVNASSSASTGFTNLGSNYATVPGNIVTSSSMDGMSSHTSTVSHQPQSIPPPAIPARPAITKLQQATPSPPQRPAPQAPPTIASQQREIVDQFGQSIEWNDVPSQGHVQWERTPEKTSYRLPDDPFDVQWSKVAINNTNPFGMESAQVNI